MVVKWDHLFGPLTWWPNGLSSYGFEGFHSQLWPSLVVVFTSGWHHCDWKILQNTSKRACRWSWSGIKIDRKTGTIPTNICCMWYSCPRRYSIKIKIKISQKNTKNRSTIEMPPNLRNGACQWSWSGISCLGLSLGDPTDFLPMGSKVSTRSCGLR